MVLAGIEPMIVEIMKIQDVQRDNGLDVCWMEDEGLANMVVSADLLCGNGGFAKICQTHLYIASTSLN